MPRDASQGSAETQVLHSASAGDAWTRCGPSPSRQREVLVLRYYADLSEAQIAQALEISPGAVKSHAHRGLPSLRATIRRPEMP